MKEMPDLGLGIVMNKKLQAKDKMIEYFIYPKRNSGRGTVITKLPYGYNKPKNCYE